jgi:hypothetical protein
VEHTGEAELGDSEADVATRERVESEEEGVD